MEEYRKQPDWLVERARKLRKSMSKPEVLLWQRLKPAKSGLSIRRQVPLLGKFVVDFYYPPRKTVFEIDGKHHLDTYEIDCERDQAFANEGIIVVRIQAASVLADLGSVVDYIMKICEGEFSVDDL